jgi:hypothetical protein
MSQDNVVNLSDKQKPVTYTIQVRHWFDGTVEMHVVDIGDDERSKKALRYALLLMARSLRK